MKKYVKTSDMPKGNITIYRIKMYLKRMCVMLYGIFHRTKKKVLFESFGGTKYSDNPRAISEKMHELYPDFEIVWYLKDSNVPYKMLPDYVRTIANKKEFIKELATTFAYVTNFQMEPEKYKKRKQFFVQTWHGDIVPKKVAYDIWIDRKRPIPITDNQVTDICVAASNIGENVYRTAFHYQGEVLNIGMPRNDVLVNNPIENAEITRNRLGLSDDTKVLLYAPTFRDNLKGAQKITVDLEDTLDHLSAKGENWICLIRAHAGFDLDISGIGGRMLDVTMYPDMADLLQITDMLISDYSSSPGDFILLDRPVILAVYDIEEYQEKHRKFNFSLEEAGFILAKNQEELDYIIDTKTPQDYKENCERIRRYFNKNETGRSSEEICRKINEAYGRYFVS